MRVLARQLILSPRNLKQGSINPVETLAHQFCATLADKRYGLRFSQEFTHPVALQDHHTWLLLSSLFHFLSVAILALPVFACDKAGCVSGL
ncbi:hypothetical protein BDM02DRAFT_3114412 [Thelephora ganbajun]|uniref:Uncharacterized protein n=1 Tax=Thelephora ganbajun TaxID=370292 RepID=A0ACB6ZH27_THEGA|nr:hypothetical protein BDM02DRAFT_3114412 [Thelephora ganbajun]